jgi:hypothetical protein
MAAISLPQCQICGGRSIETDWVEHNGLIQLGRCQRCDHRWTSSLGSAPSVLARAGGARRPRLHAGTPAQPPGARTTPARTGNRRTKGAA